MAPNAISFVDSGYEIQWTVPTDEYLVDAVLSDEGSVAALVHGRDGAPWVRVIRDGREESHLRASEETAMSLEYETGGAIRWATSDSVWVGGCDVASGHVRVHLVDLRAGSVRATVVVHDPFGDAQIRIEHAVDGRTCILVLDGGQHGCAAHRLRWMPESDHVSVHRIVARAEKPLDDLWVACGLLDGSLLTVDGNGVVRRLAEDGNVLADLDAQRELSGYPIRIEPTSGERVIVFVSGRTEYAFLLDARNLRVIAEILVDPNDRVEAAPQGHPVVHASTVVPEPFDFRDPSKHVVYWYVPW